MTKLMMNARNCILVSVISLSCHGNIELPEEAVRLFGDIHVETSEVESFDEFDGEFGGWQIYEIEAVMYHRILVLYYIDNGIYQDFVFYDTTQNRESVLRYFSARWRFLARGIREGLINQTEAGGLSKGALAYYIDTSGWNVSPVWSNIVPNRIRASDLLGYASDLEDVLEAEASRVDVGQ